MFASGTLPTAPPPPRPPAGKVGSHTNASPSLSYPDRRPFPISQYEMRPWCLVFSTVHVYFGLHSIAFTGQFISDVSYETPPFNPVSHLPPGSSLSDRSFLTLSNHLRFGVPLVLFPPDTSITIIILPTYCSSLLNTTLFWTWTQV